MTSVKKILGCLNALTQEAKLDVVEKVHLFLTENLEGVSKELLDSLLFQFRDTVSGEADPFATVKTKTKPKVPRPPTAYNLFIKKTMETLKAEQPEAKNTELMTLSAQKWNEYKASQAASQVDSATPVVDASADVSTEVVTEVVPDVGVDVVAKKPVSKKSKKVTAV